MGRTNKQNKINHNKKSSIYNRICVFNKCKTQATFGLNQRLYCAKHRKLNMIRLSDKKCEINKCKHRAIFGILKKTHCYIHKTSDMLYKKKDNKKICRIDLSGNKYKKSVPIKQLNKYCKNKINIKYEQLMIKKCKNCCNNFILNSDNTCKISSICNICVIIYNSNDVLENDLDLMFKQIDKNIHSDISELLNNTLQHQEIQNNIFNPTCILNQIRIDIENTELLLKQIYDIKIL